MRKLIAQTQHAALVFNRTISAPVEHVFSAYADAGLRAQWGAPSDTAVLIYDQTDFRVGGVDRFRCGSKSDPKYHGTTRYYEIAQNTRIVSSETIDVDGHRLFVSLTTLELSPSGAQTELKTTVQLASFVGAEMVKGHEDGHNGSLDNLVRFFAPR